MANIRSFKDFTALPAAASTEIAQHGRKVTLVAQPLTDWWRIPEPGAIDSRTGAFLALPIDSKRDFECAVWIRGEWGTLFDQGCIMLLTDDKEDVSGNWIKAGVEFENGEFIGGVVTNPWSDWAIAPAEHSTSTLNPNPYALYMRFVRMGPLVTIWQHLAPKIGTPPPENQLVKIREVRAFDVDVNGDPISQPGTKWRVGVMVCGPKNDKGTVAEFSDFSFQYLSV